MRAALAANGEFGNMGDGVSQPVKHRPTARSMGSILATPNCFGSKEAMGEFMKNPKDNLAKARTCYSKKHLG